MYRDNKETDYIWIVDGYLDAITRATDKDLNIWDYAIKTSIEDATLSREAFKNVFNFYDKELGDVEGKDDNIKLEVSNLYNEKILMRQKKEPNHYIFGWKISSGSESIQINYINNYRIHPLLNTASNIKNTFVHEYRHVPDNRKGILPDKVKEQNAINAQKQHPTYQSTTPEYKLLIERYEKYYK